MGNSNQSDEEEFCANMQRAQESIASQEVDDPRTRGELVNVLDEARSAQFDGSALHAAGFVKAIAPAKVNLFLGVGARRADGFHAVESVLHALTLHDTLYLRRLNSAEADDLHKRCETAQDNSPECALVGQNNNIAVQVRMVRKGGEGAAIVARDNIVTAAIDRLARELNACDPDAFEVYIEKNIPLQGGLGGGSSDGAATLVACAQLMGIDPANPAIEQAARSLGSDVAFFLRGGCGLYTGVGDIYERSLTPMRDTVVLVKPDAGVSTAAAYTAFDDDPQIIEATLHEQINAASDAQSVCLYNNLAPASERLVAQLAEVREWLSSRVGANNVLLCGSGATTFARCDTFAHACELVAAAKLRGWWARTTSFGAIRAAVVPTS